MIRLEHTDVHGWEAAIRGMRNPMNSWEKSDTVFGTYWGDIDGHKCFDSDGFSIGNNDHELMMRLAKAGTEHAKFMRYIIVTVDITAPLYFYKEMDCYRAGVEHNSCSTMHKIASKEFTLDDFSCEHMKNSGAIDVMYDIIIDLNMMRDDYNDYDSYVNECKCQYGMSSDEIATRKELWYGMIQLLPSSYNQRRTYQFSYQALQAIYRQRKGHKLDEWHTFREWIESLPYSEIITGEVET